MECGVQLTNELLATVYLNLAAVPIPGHAWFGDSEFKKCSREFVSFLTRYTRAGYFVHIFGG